MLGAIAAEVVATTALKLSHGFSKPLPSVVVAVGYLTSFALLALALKKLEVSVAYAVWSGVGTAAVCIVGIVAMKEPLTAAKAAGVLLIIGGVVTLNLTGSH
ncbi:small multidrug resistance pump [Saccharopolyspora phatthalungensis]|uniref:Small multidrug resistance pump n=1 Tax=Saccharopolyspora phatthalungensis TaxID=664693 RepID=A0A840Q4W7_9PSEU|nr:small multidrug resistance pump [Saccharopolyspora phatthalungensis]